MFLRSKWKWNQSFSCCCGISQAQRQLRIIQWQQQWLSQTLVNIGSVAKLSPKLLLILAHKCSCSLTSCTSSILGHCLSPYGTWTWPLSSVWILATVSSVVYRSWTWFPFWCMNCPNFAHPHYNHFLLFATKKYYFTFLTRGNWR